VTSLLALDFPPVSHVIEWPNMFGTDGPFAINKIVILMWVSAAIAFLFMWLAGRNFKMVPTGFQNLGETFVDFIQNGIIMQTMGKSGLSFTPFLGTLFIYILICNVWGIIPALQMPVNARIALPAFLAILVWFLYNFYGIKSNGFFGYFKSFMFPPGVPKALYLLVTPIEFVSTIFVRPLSLAVRLFANMLAGHLILVSFAVLSTAMFEVFPLLAVLPGALLVALTGFEVLVVFLQAYIFTILAAVFIGGAIHPEH
jgi:F-type H+-transporting ATPase subunit a